MDLSLNLLEAVRNAGVVGAGGAGFPTHVKLNSKNVEYVIANGVECEPLLNADRLLMTHYAVEIIQGLLAVKDFLKAKEGIIAIKKKNQDAIKALQKALQPGIRLHLLDDIYPLGDEQVLVYEVTKRVIPPAGLPLDVGVVVNNVATLYQVSEAILGQPFTHRLVTVTGYVKRPLTLKLPIGISVFEAIQMAGGATISEYRVLDGGPMMGKVVNDLSQPVTKTTSGIIVLPLDNPLILEKETSVEQMIRRAKSVCCRCESCSQVCPRGLLGHDIKPHKIMRAVSHSLSDPNLINAYLCSECGLCIYGCDMGLSPRKINQAIKIELRKAGVKNQPDKSKVNPSPMREYRAIPGKRLQGRFGIKDLPKITPIGERVMTPKLVKIPLHQHIGVPAKPIVMIGEEVKIGQIIGQVLEDQLGANVHASIDGKVIHIDEYIHVEGR
ncbi:MAG: RnfABCDGE type electron transport complex subunit C [Halanaerobiales bacterium]|nr:RnfABCDGE type electron transport complex subunit C [Halanaerobiales bacterium]